MDWTLAALGPGLLCLLLIPPLLLWLAPPEVQSTPDAPLLAQRELSKMGPISTNEWLMGAIFLGLLVLWVFGDNLGVGATLAAAIGVSVMLITGVLTWQDALDEKAAWDTMIWIGLLIMLAGKLNQYGLVSWFGKEFGSHIEGHRKIVVYAVVATIYFYAHYFFRERNCARQCSIPALYGLNGRFRNPSILGRHLARYS